MTVARLVIAILLMALALYVAVMNGACVIASYRNARRGIDKHHSTVPLVSLVFAALALAAYPYRPRLWIGAIALLDAGNWLLVVGIPWALIRRIGRARR